MARRRGIARRLRRQARRLARAGVLLGIGAMALALVVALLLEPGAGRAARTRVGSGFRATTRRSRSSSRRSRVRLTSTSRAKGAGESPTKPATKSRGPRARSPPPSGPRPPESWRCAAPRSTRAPSRSRVSTALRSKLGSRPYRGKISVRAGARGLRVVNIVGIEAYLASVVGSEMYASSTPAAALEAQAIAARTYARYEIEKRGRIPLPDNQEAQAYYGIERETAATRAAAAATRHRVLAFDDDLLPAFYHSTCGGRTVDGSDLLGSPAPAAPRRVLRLLATRRNTSGGMLGSARSRSRRSLRS